MDTWAWAWGYPLVEVRETEKEMIQSKTKKHANDKPHLRSTQEVTGMIFMQRTAT
jgi:hypothetical protein